MEEQICDWGGGLPNDLLDCFIERVESSKDVVQFGAVCRNWRSTAKDCAKAKEGVAYTPMLLVGDEKDKHALWAFDVAADRFLSYKLSVPYGKRFCGSSYGWLAAVNDDWSVTLHKPFSSSPTTVILPPVYPPEAEYVAMPESMLSRSQHYHVRKLIMSADPVANRDECVVVASVWGLHDLAVFRPGRDSAWSAVTCPGALIPQDLMLLRGTSRVYAVGALSDIRFIDLQHMDRDSVTIRPPDPAKQRKRDYNNYLVQSPDGETTYLVRRLFKKRPLWKVNIRSTSKVKVFVLDLATGEYEQVRSIGDSALFLGDSASLCVKASRGGAYLPNCIYFTHDVDMNNSSRWEIRDIGIYDIQTDRFKARHRIPKSTSQAMGWRPPIFVLPPMIF